MRFMGDWEIDCIDPGLIVPDMISSSSSMNVFLNLGCFYIETIMFQENFDMKYNSGLHKLWTVLLSSADRGSCAPKCVS